MSGNDKVNILMVDDQPSKLLSYEVILKELDENLIKATSGREALEHLLKTDIALVLMDVSMPDIDGFELAEMIRQHPRFQKIAIIFISAVHLTDVDRVKGYQRGAVDYISVPVVPDVLKAKVNIFVELHRKTRQLEILNQQLEQRIAERTAALIRTEQLAAVGRLAATVSHEINNPLEAVTNLLYLIGKDTNLSPQSRQRLQLADQELDRVAHIAKQTLGFYRDNTAPNWVDVSQTIDELLAVYSYKVRNRDIRIEKELDPSARLFASAGEFRQVFSNLFVNAVDATQSGGRIRIRVRTARDWRNPARLGVRISVADDGCGISPQHRSRIFEAFYTTKEGVGTGLGLWLSRTVMQKHDGRIEVRSQVQPGRSGTVFSVFWPDQHKANAPYTAPELNERKQCAKVP
jgi:signal transduction histidine kinase